MKKKLNRRNLAQLTLGALAAPALLRTARGEAPLKLRCPLDTAPGHPRNQGVVDYLKKVDAASGGKIQIGQQQGMIREAKRSPEIVKLVTESIGSAA